MLFRSGDPLSEAIAPHMTPLYLAIAAIGLAGADGGSRARDGVRLVVTARALLPSGHVSTSMEREVYLQAERHARAALGDEVYAAYDVLTKAAFGGRRLAARVDETFVIPAESASGKAEIHHIKVRFQPFIQR